MIVENEIFYDKRNHKTYVAEIVGSELALLKPIEIGAIENIKGLTYGMAGDTLAESKVVPNDLIKLVVPDSRGKQHFHDMPIFRIGKMYHPANNPCNQLLLDPNCYCRIKCLREKDNYKLAEDKISNTQPPVNKAPAETKTKRKTTRKKKPAPSTKTGHRGIGNRAPLGRVTTKSKKSSIKNKK